MTRTIEITVRWADFTPMDALALGTREAARGLGLDREIRTVEAGKRADFILLADDPLADIRALRQVEMVFRDGQLVARHGHLVLPGAYSPFEPPRK